MRPWRDITWHLGSRVASAALSIGLFALIARTYEADRAAAILFFSFVFGFLIATLRTLHALTANLQGRESRSRRLRRVTDAAWRLVLIAPASLAVAVVLFLAHPLGATAIAMAATMALLCGWDTDLIRAALGRGPLLAPAMALGGAISLAYLFLASPSSLDAGALAFVLQWLPVALLNAAVWVRIALKRLRLARKRVPSVSVATIFGPLIVALFDGAVLNAPFITSLDLEPNAGLDLAIATRLFVAALPLFPLITHWSYAGKLGQAAHRVHVPEPALYSVLQGASGLLIGSAFAVLFMLLSAQQVTLQAYVLFVGLLLAYVCHAVTARFVSPQLTIRSRLFLYGGVLSLLYAEFALAAGGLASNAVLVVSIQVFALTLAAGVAAGLAHSARSR